MSKFLDELLDHVQSSYDSGSRDCAITAINSLGENARRMLEIGIEMDDKDK